MFEQEQVERRGFRRLLLPLLMVGPQDSVGVTCSGGFLEGLVAIIGHDRQTLHHARNSDETLDWLNLNQV